MSLKFKVNFGSFSCVNRRNFVLRLKYAMNSKNIKRLIL